MSDRSYVASYKPTVFIGGYWVDDAQSCEWQATKPKEPLYGFRDVDFREVAEGQRLVHGILDLNFRYKGYLSLALARLANLTPDRRVIQDIESSEGDGPSAPRRLRDIIHAATSGGNDFATARIDPLILEPEARRQFLEKSFQEFDIETFTKLSQALRDDLWDTTVDELGLPHVESARPSPVDWPYPFDMSVVYDPPDPLNPRQNQDPARVEILRECHLVGVSKMITNTVPGGARAVVERYQFIARKVE